MATLPVHQPQIPYLGRIPGGLHNGSMIRIKGLMKHSAHRFVINLQCGPVIHPLDDVALHLSVRPPEFTIVRNHYEKFQWGGEERSGGLPIRRGHQYEILILAEHTGYKIAIDGKHFCEFRHRIPLSRVQFVHVQGDTEVSYIGLDNDGNHHHTHHHHEPHHIHSSMHHVQAPVHHVQAPTHHIQASMHHVQAPTAPPIGINPPVEIRPIYAAMPMPTPIPTPPPPPPYSPAYIHRPIETNPYSHTPSLYPTLQQPIKVETQCQPSYPMNTYYESKKKNHTALKIAAAAGGIGLGAYAISRALHHSSSDSD